MLTDADWCWLMLIDADWCWLMLIDANWCFAYCCWLISAYQWYADWYADWCWSMLIDADWCTNFFHQIFIAEDISYMLVWIHLQSSPCTITLHCNLGSIMHVREHWGSPIIGSSARRLVIGASHRGTLNPVDTLPDPQLHHLSQYSNWIRTQKLYFKFQTLPHIPHPARRYLSVPLIAHLWVRLP